MNATPHPDDDPATTPGPAPSGERARVDPTVAHNARVWNHWLGGKDCYASDRAVGDHVASLFPSIVQVARADRGFLRRAVRHLTAEAGMRQFLDIGTGLPTSDNTHEVAQAAAPGSRIVYVDNDPMVLVHAEALLTSTPEGATDYIEADARDTRRVLAEASRTLDFDRPVALMMLGVLNFIEDDDEVAALVRRLVDALAPGSHVALSHPIVHTGEGGNAEAMAYWNENATPPITGRTPEQVAALLEGLTVLEPGVVSCSRWRPDVGDDGAQPAWVAQVAAVARKD
ncbi:SAM-dependent methyltransferase [Nocardiopsis halophila]|uniref:SAM-dependent methyltransferase n=1 Tax=Nocardiopsis halophila TaxID=141692 RepID=UPI00034A5882|nr:SAM-dependent methyltransferase [Nocardiopsis halophila]